MNCSIFGHISNTVSKFIRFSFIFLLIKKSSSSSFVFCLLSFVSLSECFNLLLVWSGLLAILSGLAFGSLICTHFIAKFTENLQKPFQFFRFGFINFICHEIFLSIRRRVVLAADFENFT